MTPFVTSTFSFTDAIFFARRLASTAAISTDIASNNDLKAKKDSEYKGCLHER
jgi:hypothetical protein